MKCLTAFLLLACPALCARAEEVPGTIVLAASNAVIEANGGSAKYENKADRLCVGFWNSTNTVVRWRAAIPARGAYRVVVVYAAQIGPGGTDVRVDVGDTQSANGLAKSTDDWGRFRDLDLGPVLLRRPGDVDVAVRVTRMSTGSAWNLRAVKLAPE